MKEIVPISQSCILMFNYVIILVLVFVPRASKPIKTLKNIHFLI